MDDALTKSNNNFTSANLNSFFTVYRDGLLQHYKNSNQTQPTLIDALQQCDKFIGVSAAACEYGLESLNIPG